MFRVQRQEFNNLVIPIGLNVWDFPDTSRSVFAATEECLGPYTLDLKRSL